ncbi:hypothetical protein JW890_05305 [candidate division WOR-3 bacterium]|nr:hypothetical protein [candidate division WOR-3 bacterium]
MKFIPFVLSILVLPAYLGAGYIEYVNFGKHIYPCLSQTVASGGGGITCDPLVNPACRNWGKYSFAAGAGIKYFTESEVTSVFDSYNNRIGRITLSQNSRAYLSPYYLFFSANFQNLGTGIYLAQSADVDYEYKYTERNSFYQVVSELSKKSFGSCISYGLILNYSFNRFSAGADLSYHSLDRTKVYERKFFEPGRVDTLLEEKTFSGAFIFKTGIKYVLGRYTAAFVLSTNDSESNIPIRAGIGISVKNPSFIPTKISFDYKRSFYGHLNDSLKDAGSYHFGLENKFFNKTVFSIGGGYEENPFAKEAGLFFFTTGFIYDVEPFSFSLSFKYDQREYPKPGEEKNSVRDSSIGILFGVNYLL